MKDLLNPLFSEKLYGHDKLFDNLKDLYKKKKFPKTLLLSGEKGIGKYTFVIHFLKYIFDENNYDLENKSINSNSQIFNQISKQIYENIVTIGGVNTNVKIDEIRELKQLLSKTTINHMPRFIILDDIELFNSNSLNALLKLIEEPTSKNNFILINNKQRDLLPTIHSRCIEAKIFLNKIKRTETINYLINSFQLQDSNEYKATNISPGNFVFYSNLCSDNDISSNLSFIDKIDKLLKLYKKTKNKQFIKLSVFITNQYYYNLSIKNKSKIVSINSIKLKIINNLNDLVTYNLNANLVINSIYKYNYGE